MLLFVYAVSDVCFNNIHVHVHVHKVFNTLRLSVPLTCTD